MRNMVIIAKVNSLDPMHEEDCYQIISLRKKSSKKSKRNRHQPQRLKSKQLLKGRNREAEQKQEFSCNKLDRKNQKKKANEISNGNTIIFDPYNSYMIRQISKPLNQRSLARPKTRKQASNNSTTKSLSLSLNKKLSDIEQTQQDEEQENDKQYIKMEISKASDYFLSGFTKQKRNKKRISGQWSKSKRATSQKLYYSMGKQRKSGKSIQKTHKVWK